MFEVLPENNIISYADDTIIISTGKNWNAAQKNTIKNLQKVGNWLAMNQLSLNVEKTYSITFGIYINSLPDNITIDINGELIKRVPYTKYLGVIIDCHLRWGVHVQQILNKTRYLLYIFRRFSEYMSSETMMIIYYVLFHSKFS